MNTEEENWRSPLQVKSKIAELRRLHDQVKSKMSVEESADPTSVWGYYKDVQEIVNFQERHWSPALNAIDDGNNPVDATKREAPSSVISRTSLKRSGDESLTGEAPVDHQRTSNKSDGSVDHQRREAPSSGSVDHQRREAPSSGSVDHQRKPFLSRDSPSRLQPGDDDTLEDSTLSGK